MKFLMIILLLGLFTASNAFICAWNSDNWTPGAYKESRPDEKFEDGMTLLNESITDFSTFVISEFLMAITAEKGSMLDFARVNAVAAALDYELGENEALMTGISKSSLNITTTRLEASALLNEIQMAIIAIKSNEVIADEKNRN